MADARRGHPARALPQRDTGGAHGNGARAVRGWRRDEGAGDGVQ